MQIEVERKALVAGLKAATSATDKRVTVPILSALLMRANGALEIQGTDLDLTRTARVAIVEGVGSGDYLIEEPRALLAVIKAATSDRVQLTAVPGEQGAVLEWRAGPVAATRKPEKAVEDFPARHVVGGFLEASVGDEFEAIMRRVMPAVSNEETRYYLNGVAVRHLTGTTYRLAATDGHRLHIAEVDLPDAAGDGWVGDVIIPRRGLAAMLDVIGRKRDGARLVIGRSLPGNADAMTLPEPVPPGGAPTSVSFEGEAGSMLIKLIDGTFPDVMRVVPEAAQTSLRVDRAAMMRAVTAVCAGLTGKARAVRIDVEPHSLTVSGGSAHSIETSVSVACEAIGHSYHVGFNGQYLIEAMEALGGDVVCFQWDALPEGDGALGVASCPTKLVNPADGKMLVVLMPMRV